MNNDNKVNSIQETFKLERDIRELRKQESGLINSIEFFERECKDLDVLRIFVRAIPTEVLASCSTRMHAEHAEIASVSHDTKALIRNDIMSSLKKELNDVRWSIQHKYTELIKSVRAEAPAEV